MNKNKLKKILLIAITVIGVGIVATGSYAWQVFTSAITNIQEEIEYKKTEKRMEEINLAEGDPITVLLMGIDEPEDEEDIYQRSDTLILLTLNPHEQTTHMVSIPRDTYTEIIGQGTKEKINHAYAYGGTEMTIRTLETFLDVPVDYFVKINMDGFKDIVDAVDGIEVNNDFAFTYGGVEFKEGYNQLNGKEALLYARMRQDDPRGDFGRQERQRQVIEGVVDKGTTLKGITSSVSNFKEVIEAVEGNVRTNLDVQEMWKIQSNYRGAFNNVIEHEILGEETEINETYYFVPNEEKVQELSEELNGQLKEQYGKQQ
ncbi:LCP family glycopolymer transferase [Virgibacillus sediminis]|uniref:LCP family protein n=1 Tax=Virgibacillus sediminis TaxID=202260 RepID=A0ABV7A414_9BACI